MAPASCEAEAEVRRTGVWRMHVNPGRGHWFRQGRRFFGSVGRWRSPDRDRLRLGTVGHIHFGQRCVRGVRLLLPAGSFDRDEAVFWKPLIFARDQMNRGQHWLTPIGRLRTGVSLEQARAKMTMLRASPETFSWPRPSSDG